jgi:hypothetical protein
MTTAFRIQNVNLIMILEYFSWSMLSYSNILYFSILLHSFNTEYPQLLTTEGGRVRLKHVLIEFKK